jgi:hypothetical protein
MTIVLLQGVASTATSSEQHVMYQHMFDHGVVG